MPQHAMLLIIHFCLSFRGRREKGFVWPTLKVGRHQGSCCRDMLQRQKICVVHTEATFSRDVAESRCSSEKYFFFRRFISQFYAPARGNDACIVLKFRKVLSFTSSALQNVITLHIFLYPKLLFLLCSGRNEEPFRLMFDALIFALENESAEDFQLMNSYLYVDLIINLVDNV